MIVGRDIEKSLIFLFLRSCIFGCGGNGVWLFYIIYLFNNVFYFYVFEFYFFFRNVCFFCLNKNDFFEKKKGYVM